MPDGKHRHWKRFSIRTLLLLISLIGVVFGIGTICIDEYRQQARSLAVVQRLQGRVEFIPAHGPAWQRWLVTTMLGNESYAEVNIVDLSGKSVDDAMLQQLAGLRFLRELTLDRTQITDAGMDALRSFPRLRSLSLRFTGISDKSTTVIRDLSNLLWLYLTHTRISDSSIGNLAKLKQLDELYVRWTNITDAGAEELKRVLPGCSVFHHRLQD
jgi:hypothetical protein